jgi:hypothetical protein
MNEFQPIPGVIYEVELKPGWLETWRYCPDSPEDHRPWLREFGDAWYARDLGKCKVIREVFNPHPPTRTEWGVIEPRHGVLASLYDRKSDAQEQAARVNGMVKARQVQLGEWKEVDSDAR